MGVYLFKEIKMDEEKFSTKDIYLAAAIIAFGGEYIGADKSEPRHMEFQFRIGDSVDLDDIHTQWVNQTLKINAVAFKNAIQQMKSVVHSV